MSAQDVQDAQPTFDRIVAASERITARRPDGTYRSHVDRVHEALMAHLRQLRGRLRRCAADSVLGHGRFTAQRIAEELIELAAGLEALADEVAPVTTKSSQKALEAHVMCYNTGRAPDQRTRMTLSLDAQKYLAYGCGDREFGENLPNGARHGAAGRELVEAGFVAYVARTPGGLAYQTVTPAGQAHYEATKETS